MASFRYLRLHASHRKRHLVVICGTLFLILLLMFTRFGPAMKLELDTQDRLMGFGRPAPDRTDLCFVGLDTDSKTLEPLFPEDIDQSRALQIMQREWPWSREVHALAIERLLDAGAKAVVLDFLFPTPKEGDDALSKVLRKYPGRIVLGTNFARDVSKENARFMGRLELPSRTIIAEPSAANPNLGYVNFWPSWNGKVRAATFHMTLPESVGMTILDEKEPVWRSFAAAALVAAGHADKIPDGKGLKPFRFSDSGSAVMSKVIPYYSIFVTGMWEANYKNGEFFRDKIVLLGPAAEEFHDYHDTPVGTLLGPIIHLNAISAALSGAFYNESPEWVTVLLLMLATFIAYLVVWKFRNPIAGLLVLLAVVVVYILGALLVFSYGDLLLPVASPTAGLLVAGIFAFGFEYAIEQMERARTRKTLERFVSHNVVKAILDNPAGIADALRPQRKRVTVLFSDVRGFTAMSEHADPQALVDQLNEYLAAMVEIVFRHDGTLDKFIGDAVMAVWGNITSKGEKEDALSAVHAALDMRESLANLNAKWRTEGRKELAFGIGIHHGEALCGEIGSERKSDPTVMGDTVNLGSRLEGLTKKYSCDLLISETVAEHVKDSFIMRTADLVRVSGRSQPVAVFAVEGRNAAEVDSPLNERLAKFEEGIARYRQRDFRRAAEIFAELALANPEHSLTSMYIKRTERYLAAPPPEDWDGSETMDSK